MRLIVPLRRLRRSEDRTGTSPSATMRAPLRPDRLLDAPDLDYRSASPFAGEAAGPTALHQDSRISLPSIFAMFLRLGLLSFGGGLTGWMHREVVVRKSWLSDDVFLTGLALAQILPGTNVTNLAVYIGQHLRGPVGAVTALTGLVSGPFLAVIALASVYGRIATIPWVYAALEGLAAAAVGLLIIMAVRSVRHSAHDLVSILVILGTFAGISLFDLPLVPVAACAAAVSVAAALWQGRRRQGNPDA